MKNVKNYVKIVEWWWKIDTFSWKLLKQNEKNVWKIAKFFQNSDKKLETFFKQF